MQPVNERSQKKVNQVYELMNLLQLSMEAKDMITQEGFIQKIVVFHDHEVYPEANSIPSPEPEVAGPEVAVPAEVAEVAESEQDHA